CDRGDDLGDRNGGKTSPVGRSLDELASLKAEDSAAISRREHFAPARRVREGGSDEVPGARDPLHLVVRVHDEGVAGRDGTVRDERERIAAVPYAFVQSGVVEAAGSVGEQRGEEMRGLCATGRLGDAGKSIHDVARLRV